jgi:transglutaminase-like putative cysteine protease
MRTRLLFYILFFVLAPAALVHAAGYATLSDTKTFDVVNQYVITNNSNAVANDVEVTAQIGAASDSSYQQKVRFRMVPKPADTTTDSFGNMYGTFKIGRLNPGRSQTVLIEKIIKNSGITYSDDIFALCPSYHDFFADKTNEQYVQPSKFIESDAREIRDDAAKFPQEDTPAKQVRDIYTAVNTLLTYDTNPAYANKGALSACRTKRGVCTEFAGLLVAYCRALGIPARVVAGYWIHEDTPLNVPIDISGADEAHAWAEFYLPGAGWIPIEPTKITTADHVRVPDYSYFAALQTERQTAQKIEHERHILWAYGMGPDCDPNLSIKCYFEGIGKNGDQDPGGKLDLKFDKETLTLIPDEPAK